MASQIKDSKITACIIAGGKSKRFGQDKLFHKHNGIALIEHVINVLKIVFDDIIIIANNKDKFSHLGLPVFADLIPDTGPLGGIYTALNYSAAHKNFCFAGDLPNLNADLIKYMISIPGRHDIVVPFINGYYEALHTIYTKNCFNLIKDNILSENYQVIKLYDKCTIRKVNETEINKFAPAEIVFRNINYLSDLE